MVVANKLLVLAVACCCAYSLPQETPKQKNTIFGDEQLQGEIFENYGEVMFNDARDAALYRLPTTTRPTHYNLLWTMDFTSDPQSFSGTVEILLHATEAGVNQIVIHTDGLTIGTVTLVQGTTALPVTHVEESDFHFLRINLDTGTLAYDATNPVLYSLTIAFEAPMREDMTGIYKSWFRNNYNDEVSWMASTHFQATAARRAFPCYDEPNLKATFDITIRRPTAYRSWSLMRRASTVDVTGTPGYQDDIYHRTPVMSTYLLCIIVAEYDSLTINDANNNLIYEVIARPNALSTGQGQYALEVGRDLLAEMNAHTDYNFYSMNEQMKMTQAAIPDFSAGAMENWGLLVYREAYLMYDPAQTTSNYKQLTAYILSHEIAHMWFGNLVTCNWWGDFWLNEGFARYYQYFLTDWVETYMGFETRFIPEQVHTALLADSVASAHPLSVASGIGDPVQIRTMFSTLSYNKGATVIRMTEHLLGHDVHRAGLRIYLRNRQFDTARPIDLFTALEEAALAAGALSEYGPDFSLIEYYNSFTLQSGHPILYVNVNHQTGDMTIQQRRFDINTGISDVNSQWVIPITFSSASNPDFANTKPTHIIRKSVTVINRGSVGDEWVLFNRQQTGYYRVNYDDYTWDLITAALRGEARTQIHEHNKAQIVNDVFQYARSGIMSYTKALNILSFLEFETDYAPWVTAMTGFTWLRNRLTGTPYLEPLEALIAQWATNVMAYLSYYPSDNNEDFMRSYLRWQLAPIMCEINRDGCRAAAVSQFNALRTSYVEVYPDNRHYVYCNGLREGSAEDFEFLRTRFIQHNVYTEKILILQTLGCTNSVDSLNQLLIDIFADNNMIRRQDYTTTLSSFASANEPNVQILFTFIQNNFNLVANAFAYIPNQSVATPLSYVSSRLRTEAEVNAFQQWATANQALLGNSYQTVMNGAESTRRSIQWTSTIVADVNNFLTTGYQPVVTTTQLPPTEPPVLEVEPRPDLTEPATPELPDSAVTSFLSLSVIFMVAIFNYVL